MIDNPKKPLFILPLKKQILRPVMISSLFIVFIVLILVFDLQPIYIGYCVAGLIIFNFFYFSRHDALAAKINKRLVSEFVRVFTFFGIYINNGYNVYQSLIKIKDFCNDDLKKLLDDLIDEIDKDKSVRPFVKFGENFDNVSIKELVLSIYQMIEEGGGKSYITQYETLFENLSSKRHKVEDEERRDKLSMLTVLPLVGSGIIMVVLTISLVQIMGGYLSVV